MTIAALIIAGLYFGAAFLVPLALAGLLSFLLQPLVRWLHRRFIPRPLAIMSVVLSTTVVIGLVFSFLAREASYLAADLPKYESNLREKAKAATSAMQSVGIWYNASRVFERLEAELKSPSEAKPIKVEVQQEEFRPLAAILTYAKLTLSPLMTLGLTFLFTIFILLQYYDLRDRLVYLFGPTEIGRTTQAFNEAAHDLSLFFRLQAGLNLSFGVVIGIAMWLIGLPNPALWGALAGVSRFVPYVGGVLAAAGPMLMAASVDPGWTLFFVTAAVIIAAEVLVGYAVEPLLFGTNTRLSPLAVLMAAIFWTTLWGPVGLLLALPITLGVVVFAEHVPRLGFFRVLFGKNPALSAAQQLYHLLLAGNESRAMEEVVNHLAQKKTLTEYVDHVFIPAMAIAAKDSNSGVFTRDQLESLKRTTKEFVELLKEVADMQSAAPQATTVPTEDTVLVLAGRGAFDQAVAEVTSFVLEQTHKMQVSCMPLGGLTGIATATEPGEPPARYLVIATVGGVTDSQLELLCRRAKRDLKPERISILTAHNSCGDIGEERRLFTSIKSLLQDLLGRLAAQRVAPPPSPGVQVQRAG